MKTIHYIFIILGLGLVGGLVYFFFFSETAKKKKLAKAIVAKNTSLSYNALMDLPLEDLKKFPV